MITYLDAAFIIKRESFSLKLETELVPLPDLLGRVTANEIFADTNLPPFDHSAMDGIAIRYHEHNQHAGKYKWNLKGEISAGHFEEISLHEDEAVQIMTGARIPRDCDSVIPIEDLTIDGTQAILKAGSLVKKSQNIRFAGEDLTINSLALAKSTRISPAHFPVIAACGQPQVSVYKKLKVGIVVTGDELVEVDKIPNHNQIRCSNLYSLIALVLQAGQTPINFGIIGDSKENFRNKINTILESDIDILLTTGGVSVGKFDFVREGLSEVGTQFHFWKTSIKPGMPMTFGTFFAGANGKKKLVFGLPGNPVSCFVNFHVYVKDAINHALQINSAPKIMAELSEEVKKKDDKRHFIPANIFTANDKSSVSVSLGASNRSSGNIFGPANSNCLIVIEEDRKNLKVGEIVECIMI